jgi:Zn-dependent oligopeptidase
VLPLAETSYLKDQLESSNQLTINPLTLSLKRSIVQNLSHVPSMKLLNHSHFINYGGSYYSYLLAKMYSAQVWHQLFAQDPLSR